MILWGLPPFKIRSTGAFALHKIILYRNQFQKQYFTGLSETINFIKVSIVRNFIRFIVTIFFILAIVTISTVNTGTQFRAFQSNLLARASPRFAARFALAISALQQIIWGCGTRHPLIRYLPFQKLPAISNRRRNGHMCQKTTRPYACLVVRSLDVL